MGNFYDQSNDHHSTVSKEKQTKPHARVPKLTLKHINKLRIMRDLEVLQHNERDANLENMYGAGGSDDGDLM